jgi:hypothetical protein
VVERKFVKAFILDFILNILNTLFVSDIKENLSFMIFSRFAEYYQRAQTSISHA